MRFSRKDELEAHSFGVKYMSEAGYDPRAMIEVMKILKASSGPSRQPEFVSTHPDPGRPELFLMATDVYLGVETPFGKSARGPGPRGRPSLARAGGRAYPDPP